VPSWRFASDNAMGNQPRDLVIGDFDAGTGDDFIVANSDDDVLQWGLSNGDGTFDGTDGCNNGPTFGVPGAPGHLALGNWRDEAGVGDGVIAGSMSQLRLTSLAETGFGGCGFTLPYGSRIFPGVDGVTGLSSGDVNGDGNDDAAASWGGMDVVAVSLLGDDGSIAQDFSVIDVGSQPMGTDLVDLNGDRKLDLAAASYGSGQIWVALGHGDGTFSAATPTPGSIPHAHSVVGLDANGDGVTDLAAGDDTGVVLLQGRGDGTFAAPVAVDAGAGPTRLSVSDVNGDGRPDLLAAYENQTPVHVLIGRGDGSFRMVEIDDSHFGGPQAIGSGDFTGDGSHDLAVVNAGNPGSVTVLLGDPNLVGPSGVDFGGQKVGVASAARTINLTNTGSGTDYVVDVTIGGGDSDQFNLVSDNCRPTVKPGASCQAVVSFKPSSDGPKSSDLALISEGPGVLEKVPLSGTGEISTVDLNPSSADFGEQNVGGTAGPRTVTLNNDGSVDVVVSSVQLAGADAGQFDLERETCTDHPVPAGGSCQAIVTFSPGSTGLKNAAVRFTDDAPSPGSTQSAALTGTGTQPAAALDPGDIDFGGTDVDGDPVERTLTVENTGTGPLQVGRVSLAGANVADFTVTSNGCSAPLDPGASCEIGVGFTPTAEGARTATVQVDSDAPGPPAQATLSGTGLTRILSFSPAAVSYGGEEVGSSASRSITVTNVGSGSVSIAGMAVAGPGGGSFDLASQSCTGAPLRAGASCNASVAFAPRAEGPVRAVLQVNDDANGAPHEIPLTGTGTAAGAAGPSRVKLTAPRGGKAKRRVTIRSTGTAPLDLSGARVTGAGHRSFRASLAGCRAPVAPGASCRAKVVFRPRARRVGTATLSLTGNQPGRLAVALEGRVWNARGGAGRPRAWGPAARFLSGGR
jgi:hypothetical protein